MVKKHVLFQVILTIFFCWQVQVQPQVHLFTLIQLQYNNNKEIKEEVKNRANYTLN